MSIFVTSIQVLIVTLGILLVGGTLSSLFRNPHWLVRSWDFPRLQILVLLLVVLTVYLAYFRVGDLLEWIFLSSVVGASAWQIYRIWPYTPAAGKEVRKVNGSDRERSLRLITSNVQMDNDQYERWLHVVRAEEPDLILAVEPDENWLEAIAELESDYPYTVKQPQDNCYGMALYSKFPLRNTQVRFLVQDDVPSIHCGVELPSGEVCYFHGVHPRPPEPTRGQDAEPRDAEVVIIGKEIKEEDDRPTIVAGDFNDVAWSHTTELFLRLSGMLDARKGRGIYNTFHANSWIMRYPLDHVFQTEDFCLVRLELLEHVGSDHYPVFIELSLQEEEFQESQRPEQGDKEEAERKIERAEEAEDVDRDNL